MKKTVDKENEKGRLPDQNNSNNEAAKRGSYHIL